MTDAPATEDELEPPPYALYSLGQIKWTAFIGGPLVAILMMSHNFRKLGEVKRANWTYYIGAGVISGLMALTLLAEQHLGKTASFSLGIPLAIGASEIAKRTQGASLTRHWNDLGRKQPFWKAALLFIGSLALMFMGMSQLMTMFSSTVQLDGGHQVTLEGYATKEDAITAGAVLTEIGTLSAERPVQFSLGRSKKGWVVEFEVVERATADPQMAAAFEAIAKVLRERVFSGGAGELKLTNALGFAQAQIAIDADGQVIRR